MGAAASLDLGERLDLGSPHAGAAPLDFNASPGTHGGGTLDLEQLDLSSPGAAPLDLGAPLETGSPHRPFGLDDLELEAPVQPGAPDPSGSAFEGVSLPGGPAQMGPPSSDGVVSFSKPSDSAVAAGSQGLVRRRPEQNGPLELDVAPLPADQAAQARKTLARERRSGVSVAPPRGRSKKRRMLALATITGVLGLGAAGFYGFTKWSESKDQSAVVSGGVNEARKHLASDRPGHWQAAADAAKHAIKADKANVDALALSAQANFAAAIDTGLDWQARVTQGKRAAAELRKASAKGAEVQKAEGLQAVVEGQGAEAVERLLAAKKANPRDASVDLFLGWAQLEASDYAAASVSFAAALKASPGRVAALYGQGNAQKGAGKHEEARASYLEAIDKSRERYKIDHVGALVGAAELADVEKFTDRENRYLEILARGDLAKSDPRAIAWAWTLAANEALRAGRVQEASQRYAKALELDAESRDAVVGEGKTLLAMKRYADARERLARVLKIDENHLDATLALAEVALREEALTESKGLIAKVLERQPPVEDQTVLSNAHRILAGALALEQDSAAKAESEYREAIKLSGPRDIRAALDLANFFVSKGRGEEARAVLGPIRARARKDPGIGVSLGVAYLGAGDAVAAEQTLRGALELRPGDSEARFQLGQALLTQNRTDEGLAAIRTAYNANKGREDIGLALAVAYEENNRLSDAAALYETLLAGETPSLNVKARAGRYFARQGSGARAIALGEEILAEANRNPAGLFLLGEKHFAASEFDKALRAYLDAVLLDKQAQYYEGAGRAAENQKGFDDALRHYKAALKLEPNYLAVLKGQARIHLGRRAFREAIAALDRASALDGKDAWSRYARGAALIDLGQLKDGIAGLERAVGLDGELAIAYYRLGRAYFDSDKAKKAAKALERATAKAGGDEDWVTEAFRVLGYAQRMARNRRAAIKAFRAYLDRNPEKGPQRSDAKRELLFLEGGGR